MDMPDHILALQCWLPIVHLQHVRTTLFPLIWAAESSGETVQFQQPLDVH